MTVTKEMVQAFLDFIKEDTWAYCGEEEKQYYHIDGLVNVEAALEAAFAAMPGPAVKVRELEWSGGNGNYPEWRADGFGFKASIDKSRASLFGEFPLFINGEWDHQKHNTLEAAKAAAQADYEARILSALTPAPDLAAENERLRKALVKSIVTAACELDGPADPTDDDTICISMGDLEAIVERHVTAALERT